MTPSWCKIRSSTVDAQRGGVRKVAARTGETSAETARFLGRIDSEEIFMRATVAILLTCLALAACGSTERKTVVVNPPPDSTTVVDRDGNARVIPNH
jgi:hypothetical protein